jgi:hypothetical protein
MQGLLYSQSIKQSHLRGHRVSKREKRLQKIRQNPKDVSFDELNQLLRDYDFELRRVTGSHHIFEYNSKEGRPKFVLPLRRPIKPYYVKDAIRLIDLIRQNKNEDDTNEEDD